MSNIVVVGSFVMDLIFQTDRRPVKGETVIGRAFDMATGGKGANQAMSAALLGANVTMVGRVGEDEFGDGQLESLSKAGVNVERVVRDPEEGTAVASIVVDAAGDNSIVVVPRANMRCAPSDVAAARPEIGAADYLLIQLEIPLETNRFAVAEAKKAGVKIILDPAPAAEIPDELLAAADIVKPNETEAARLSGVEVAGPDTAEKAARALCARGAKTVIVTLGDKGALVLENDRAELVPSVAVKARDATAAGDAFTGALAAFLGEGRSLTEAVRMANLTGALCATRVGAQPSLPDRATFEAFLKSHGL